MSTALFFDKLLSVYLSRGIMLYTTILLVLCLFVFFSRKTPKKRRVFCGAVIIYCMLYFGAIAALSFLFSSNHGPAVPAPAPPHQIIFYNQDELEAFLDAPNLPDDDLEQFLKENHYIMNGVDSRKSLESVLQAITGKPFPVVKGAPWSDIIVHVETNELYVRYEAETNEVYSFNYGLQETLEKQKDSMSYEDAKIEDTFSVNADEPFTAVQISHDFEKAVGVYFIEIPETVTMLRLYNMNAEDIEKNLENIYFDDISSLQFVTK